TTIENRASDRILFEATKKQRCLERVTSQAALELSSEQSVPDEKPDEDWIAGFFDYAKNISSEQMQGIIGILGDKLFANHFHIIPRWPMLPFIERYKDFAISGTDRGRVAQCKIEIHRQSNILQDDIYLLLRDQRPDHCIYLEKHAPRFFDACSGRSANVETKLPGVDQRKEIFSQDRGQENERENYARQHDGNHDAAMLKGPLQPRAINVPQFFKSVIKPFVKLDKPALWPSVNSL